MMRWLVRRDKTKRYLADLAAADALRDCELFASAAERYRRVISLGGDTPSIRKQLANMLKDSGQFAEAEIEYRRCLNAEPDDADTLVQMGHLFKLSQRPEMAADYFAAALAKDPLHHDTEVELATLRASSPAKPEASERSAAGASLEQRLSAMEDQQRSLGVHVAELRRLVGNAGKNLAQEVGDELVSNQWYSFVPLIVNMSSAVARIGAELQDVADRTQREIEVLRADMVRQRSDRVASGQAAPPPVPGGRSKSVHKAGHSRSGT